jgi:hypothetical protein
MTQEEALKAVRTGTGMAQNRAHEAIAGLIKNCYLKHSAMGGIEVILDSGVRNRPKQRPNCFHVKIVRKMVKKASETVQIVRMRPSVRPNPYI